MGGNQIGLSGGGSELRIGDLCNEAIIYTCVKQDTFLETSCSSKGGINHFVILIKVLMFILSLAVEEDFARFPAYFTRTLDAQPV